MNKLRLMLVNFCLFGSVVLAAENFFEKFIRRHAIIALNEAVYDTVKRHIDDYVHEFPLHCAVINEDYNAVKRLIENGADVNVRDSYYNTPLHEALWFGYESIIKLLIDHKADVNARDCLGETPLYLATRYKTVSIVKLLLDSRADVNAQISLSWFSDEATLLHQVSSHHALNLDVVKLLLDRKNIDVNASDKDGNTPLHRAAKACSSTHIELLCTHPNIDINRTNKNGERPYDVIECESTKNKLSIIKLLNGGSDALFSAIHQADDCMVCKLISDPVITKKDMSTYDENGRTPLHVAIKKVADLQTAAVFYNKHPHYGISKSTIELENTRYRSSVTILKKLVDCAKIDPNAKDGNGQTPLMYAVIGNVDVRDLFTHSGIDLNTSDNEGRTLLMYAIMARDAELVKDLVICPDVDVNAMDREGRTSLMYAMMKPWDSFLPTSDINIVKCLLAYREVNINAQDLKGRTPLMYAIMAENVDIVQCFLERSDIDVDAQDQEGRTAFNLAVAVRATDVIDLLCRRKVARKLELFLM